jgi:hypothetical protein
MCLISGGNWNNTSNAGVWNLNLNNNRTNTNNNVGFRAADYDRRTHQALNRARSSSPVRGAWCHRGVTSCRFVIRDRRTQPGGPLSGSYGERQGAATL